MSPWQNSTEVKEWPFESNILLSQTPPLTFRVNWDKWINIADQSEKTKGLNMEYWASLDITMNVSIVKYLLSFNDSEYHDLGFCLIKNMHFPFKINWYTTRVKVFIETNLGWL